MWNKHYFGHVCHYTTNFPKTIFPAPPGLGSIMEIIQHFIGQRFFFFKTAIQDHTGNKCLSINSRHHLKSFISIIYGSLFSKYALMTDKQGERTATPLHTSNNQDSSSCFVCCFFWQSQFSLTLLPLHPPSVSQVQSLLTSYCHSCT